MAHDVESDTLFLTSGPADTNHEIKYNMLRYHN